MRKLIINADDLGLSFEVNAQIEECIHRGVVTSSTLMANAPAFEDGVRIAKQHPQISVGVHLNLIEFKPLTNADIFRNHGITDEEGIFIEGAIFAMPIDKDLENAIFEEWDAQISKVEAAGIIPTHCDSHQHTHTIPKLRGTLCRVLDKHKINHVRRMIVPSILLMLRAKNKPIVVLNKDNAIKIPKKNVLYRRIRILIAKYDASMWNWQMQKDYIMTDFFYNVRNYINDRNIICLGNRDSVIELMCHPGHPAYQKETETLLNGDSWRCHDSILVSYRYLDNK